MTVFGLTLPQLGIQLIGFVAMALMIASFQARKRATMILIQSIASCLWVAQFVLLGGFTGAAMNLLAIARGVVYLQKRKYRWASERWIPALFGVLFVLTGVLTWEGPISLLPMFSMVLSSVSLFISEERTIRLLSLIASPPWLVYDFLTGSAAGTVSEVLSFTSIVIALIRFRKKDK